MGVDLFFTLQLRCTNLVPTPRTKGNNTKILIVHSTNPATTEIPHTTKFARPKERGERGNDDN